MQKTKGPILGTKDQAGTRSKKITRDLDKAVEADARSIAEGSRSVMSEPVQRYLEYLVDPRGNQMGRVPYGPGFYKRSSAVEVVCRGTVAVGTLGNGWLLVSPSNAGPTSNGICAVTTTAAYASLQPPYAIGAGSAATSWAEAPYTLPQTPENVLYRVVACAIYLTPTGSATAQDGTLYMLEYPGHMCDVMSDTTFQSHPETRTVRAIQLGDPSILNVLNWHPMRAYQSSITGAGVLGSTPVDDFAFRATPAGIGTTFNYPELGVCISGTTGTQFAFEIRCGYEVIGAAAVAPQPTVYDSRGMDLVFNTLSMKGISGWIGKPSHAEHAYYAAARKAQDRIKSGKASKGASWADKYLNGAKDVLALAREVGGFLL